jgi:hypothetical protein
VQPFRNRNDGGVSCEPAMSSRCVTELTVIVCRFAAGSCVVALLVRRRGDHGDVARVRVVDRAACERRVVDRAERLLDHLRAAVDREDDARANRFESAMKLSPTRTGSTMQLGHVPSVAAVVGLGRRVARLAGAVAVLHLVERVVVVVEEVPARDVVDVAVAVGVGRRR